MFIVLLYVLLPSVLCFVLYCNVRKPNGFPPGPPWLPIVGSYLVVRQKWLQLRYYHLVWSWLASCYGSVVGLRLGSDQIVIASGYEAAKEVLTGDDFHGRPDGFFFRLRSFGERLGVVFTDGTLWQEQRRFCVRHLRNFGYGKLDMEIQIETEARELVTKLRTQCDTAIKMHDAFDICVLNSLWAMVAGQRFDLDDDRLTQLLDIVHTSFRMLDMSGGVLNQMPFLRHIAPERSGYTQLMKILHRMWNFLEETIAEHQKTYNEDHSRDLIDSFISEMKTQEKNKVSTYTDKQLILLCLDLFMAGSETTSNTLGFAILYMMLYPKIQARVQEELDFVVGRDRQPAFRDRTRLCYVDAVLMEVQRLASIAPVTVPHRATKDTTLGGYNIPKDSTILVSLWSLHMDAAHWKDPEIFRPERFLDCNGKLVQDDWFIPFGFGRRRCLGESLAKSSLFIFFTSVLHNFSICLPPGHSTPTTSGFEGVTISPKPFYAKLSPRV